jgi:hypothetical protein
MGPLGKDYLDAPLHVTGQGEDTSLLIQQLQGGIKGTCLGLDPPFKTRAVHRETGRLPNFSGSRGGLLRVLAQIHMMDKRAYELVESLVWK